jgi:hypothetical protein
MFLLQKNEELLTFAVKREAARFGEGERTLFWIDLSRGVLQRGRHEAIPLSTVEGFGVEAHGPRLFCDLGSARMILYEGGPGDLERLRESAGELAGFCGVAVMEG